MLRVGLVGCGAIGNIIADEVNKKSIDIELCSCWDNDKEKRRLMAEKIGTASILPPDEMSEHVELIVEAAHKSVVEKLLRIAIKDNKRLLVVSIGGIIGHEDLVAKIAAGKGELFIPSGAIAGLDAIKALPKETITSSRIKTTKPPKGVAGAPFFRENPVELESLGKPTKIFSGSAKEAVNAFPKNVNVAAALSFAGIGLEKTRVELVIDPKATKNTHEICVEGSFGKIVTKTENMPSPANPKTSYLAALSVIATINKIISTVHIGS